jgi:uncharacterized membrane protein YsdA (DUF1294 family)
MSRRHRTQITFGIVAIIATAVLFLLLQTTTTWPWYITWPLAASVVAFVCYALDKGMAKANTARIPEAALHFQALVGGAVGALLGMVVFRHKRNFRAHPLFLPVIFLGATIWGLIIYQMTR